jgi:tetratricopeptide (TPR) repeat protein
MTTDRPKDDHEDNDQSDIEGDERDDGGMEPQRLIALAEFRDLPARAAPPTSRIEDMMRELIPMFDEIDTQAAVDLAAIMDRYSRRDVSSQGLVGSAHDPGGFSDALMTVVEIADWLCSAGSAAGAAGLCGYANSLLMAAQEGDLDPPSKSFDPSSDPAVARLRVVTGLLALRLGLLEDAERLFVEAVDISAAGANDHELANAHLNIANVHRFRGATGEARLAAARASEFYRKARDEIGHGMALLTLSSIAGEAGDLANSEAILSDAEDVVRSLRNAGLTSSVHGQRARNLADKGQLVEAERAFQLSLRAARRAHDIDKQAAALHSLASVASNSGNESLAVRRFLAVAQFAERFNLVSRQLDVYPWLVQVLGTVGRKDEALDIAQRLHTLTLDLDRPAGASRALLAATLLDNGHLNDGCVQAEAAVAELDDYDPTGMWSSNMHNLIVGLRGQHRLRDSWESLAAMIRGRHGLVAPDAPVSGSADARSDVPASVDREARRAAARLHQDLAFALLGEMADRDPGATSNSTSSTGMTTATVGERVWQAVEALLVEALMLVPSDERAWDALIAESQLGESLPPVRVRVIEVGIEAARTHRQEGVERQLLNDLAITHIDGGDLRVALALLERNAATAREGGDVESERIARFNLAETLRRLDRYDDAHISASAALELAIVLDEDVDECRLRVGQTLTDLGRPEEARDELGAVLASQSLTPALHAAATASMGRVEYALGNYARAAELYGRAARTEVQSTIQYAETLIAWCDALAHLDDRRTYKRQLQQWVNTVQANGFDTEWAVPSMLRIAITWAEMRRPRYGGEMLAIIVLLALAETPDEEAPHTASDGAKADHVSPNEPVWRPGVAMWVVASQLVRQRSAGLVFAATESAMETQLRDVISGAAADQVMRMVRELTDRIEASEGPEDASGDPG